MWAVLGLSFFLLGSLVRCFASGHCVAEQRLGCLGLAGLSVKQENRTRPWSHVDNGTIDSAALWKLVLCFGWLMGKVARWNWTVSTDQPKPSLP